MSEDAVSSTGRAFISGMIQGWASSLEDPNEVKRVIKDMNKFAKKLATGAGVTLFEEKDGTR